jgi:hypothetical protein
MAGIRSHREWPYLTRMPPFARTRELLFMIESCIDGLLRDISDKAK